MFNQCIRAIAEVIAIDSVESCQETGAPFGKGVNDALIFTMEKAKQLGFKTVNGDGYYGYAEVGSGELFAILGHLDTVPIGKDWSQNPLGGEIIDNVMYGRGILDDKGPMYACMYAVAELLGEGCKPTKRLRLIFGCDEESGWQCMDKYVAEEEIPVFAFTPDGDFPVINCEKGIVYYDVSLAAPSGVERACGGDRANMVMDYAEIELADVSRIKQESLAKFGVNLNGNTLSAKGKSAHGSQPHKGDNAFFKLVALLGSDVGGEWAALSSVIVNTDGVGYGIKLHDDVSGDLTVNIGVLSLDIQGQLHFSLDIRYPISYDKPLILSRLKENLVDCTIVETFCHNSLYIDKSHPLVVSLLNAYEQVVGERAEPISIGGGTYARALPCAVAFGPIFPWQTSTIHQKDEGVNLDDLRKMYDVYKAAIKQLAFS